jgi:probable HAF family extracellular repeat protein
LVSSANAINDAGQVVGSVVGTVTSFSSLRAFLYSGGVMQDLGTLPGGSYSEALAINAMGQVVGAGITASGQLHAFLYSNGVMQDLGNFPGGDGSFANGINDAGEVVGFGESLSTRTEHAFLYSDGVMQDLNDLTSGSGWTLYGANAINNSGQIVGYGLNPSGQEDAFLLTPVPEPSSLVLLALGALGLTARRRRR